MSDIPPVTFVMQDVPALYGAERVTLDLMAGLRAAGVAVDLLTLGETRVQPPAEALSAAARASGLPVRRLPVAGRFSRDLVRDLRAHVERTGGLLHTVGYKAHVHALLAARGRARTVTTIHGWLVRPEFKERLYEWIEVQALRHDDAVVCLTSYYERVLRSRGVRANRLHRIPTGLSPAALPERAIALPRPPGRFTVGLIGRLSWEKNHDLLLRAAARLRREGVDLALVLAGEGPERPRVEALARELGLAAHVEFAGYARMPDLMPRLHAVVLCSRIENLPLSLLEAMAWSRPVVATRVGGVPDVVVDGITGCLVASDDEVGLAAALRRLAGDPGLAYRLGQAGRRRVEDEFTLARCVARHQELYRRLAS